jgi:hypothetical protein
MSYIHNDRPRTEIGVTMIAMFGVLTDSLDVNEDAVPMGWREYDFSPMDFKILHCLTSKTPHKYLLSAIILNHHHGH